MTGASKLRIVTSLVAALLGGEGIVRAELVTIEFTAKVVAVGVPGMDGLVGESGSGIVRYDNAGPFTETYVNDDWRSYYFHVPPAEFRFELPAADVSLVAGSCTGCVADLGDVEVDISNDFLDLITDGPCGAYAGTQVMDRIRFFSHRVAQTLDGHESGMVLYFADSSAASLAMPLVTNVVDPAVYDRSFFHVTIEIGGGVTTAGLCLALDSVTVTAIDTCGDGVVQASEDCDDGNRDDDDCCSSTCAAVTGTCDDGNACTLEDRCRRGVCTGKSVECAPVPCHEASACDSATGTCVTADIVADGSPCDDLAACSEGDACRAGACVGVYRTAASIVCTRDELLGAPCSSSLPKPVRTVLRAKLTRVRKLLERATRAAGTRKAAKAMAAAGRQLDGLATKMGKAKVPETCRATIVALVRARKQALDAIVR